MVPTAMPAASSRASFCVRDGGHCSSILALLLLALLGVCYSETARPSAPATRYNRIGETRTTTTRISSSDVAPRRLPDSPFPVSPRGPPSLIYVYNVTNATDAERWLVQSAVGLIAQGGGRGEGEGATNAALASVDALDRHAGGEAGVPDFLLSLLPAPLNFSFQYELASLLRMFRTREERGGGAGGGGGGIRGYIRACPGSLHAAVSLSGIYGGVIAADDDSERLAKTRVGLERLLDVRGYDLERDVWEPHRRAFSSRILFNQRPSALAYTTDFAVYARAFALYDPQLTSPLAQRALQNLEPTSTVLGWGDEVHFVTSASRHGTHVLCSDTTTNMPVYMNFGPTVEATKTAIAESSSSKMASESAGPLNRGHRHQATETTASPSAVCTVSADDPKHLVAFQFTDGDSVTWTMGNFLSSRYDWWASPHRGQVPIAWTLQPMLQELHPRYLEWIAKSATSNDTLLAGPSGAGYAYLDQFPNPRARRRFANWTTDNMDRAAQIVQQSSSSSSSYPHTLLPMINQIQVGEYRDVYEWELVERNPSLTAVLVDEYYNLTIRGDARYIQVPSSPSSPTATISSTVVVTSRRHALSKQFGDLTPEQLVEHLNTAAPTNLRQTTAYSIVGVEVWGYGVTDIVRVVEQLRRDRVKVVGLDEYFACLKEHALGELPSSSEVISSQK